VCTFASPTNVDKCRLEAHVLDITEYHQALVPWRTPTTTQTVLMRSSLPLEQRVLHDRTPKDSSGGFTAFVRSAKARLIQDLKLLPTRGDTPTTTERHNVTFYEDEPGNQVLLVYAPNGSTRLEFISLSLLAPSP
jgi:hypothetical protein